MLVNTVRMLACIFVGFAILAFEGDLSILAGSPQLIAIAALSGISTAAFTVTWLLSVKQGAYMMVDVFLLSGVLLPLLLCQFIYGETIALVQWGGITLLIVAGYIVCTYNVSINGKMSVRALVLCGASADQRSSRIYRISKTALAAKAASAVFIFI